MTQRTSPPSDKSEAVNANEDLCDILEQYKRHNLNNSEKIKQTLKRLKELSEK